jgi:hypothetical protein
MREGAAAAGCVVRHYSMPFSGYRAFFWLLDWIHGLLMAAAGNVIVLSSIKIGAPARKEGT